MIKISNHQIINNNHKKLETYSNIYTDYQKLLIWFVDHIWNDLKYKNKKEKWSWDTKNKAFKLGKYYPKLKDLILPIEHQHWSARVIKTAVTQSLGIIRSVIIKYNKQHFYVSKLQKTYDLNLTEENKIALQKAQIKLKKLLPNKPIVKNISIELNSLNVKINSFNKKQFSYEIIFQSLGNKYSKFSLFIKHTKHSNIMLNIGSLMTSILLKEKSIDLRWNIIAQKNTGTKIIGADIGLNTAVSLSDNQQTISCNHGHNLKTICKKISTKKRGSKNYKKAVAHRINYINWSVKQLNLNGIKLINVESNKNIKHSRRLSSYLNSWSWRDINSALINQCELLGVQVKHNKSYYRSQRCFSCGYVHKSNRSQETFECCHCGHTDNADLNAAKNNSITLFSISYDFMALKLNRTGFFWGINSLFDLNGEELAVSHTKKKK